MAISVFIFFEYFGRNFILSLYEFFLEFGKLLQIIVFLVFKGLNIFLFFLLYLFLILLFIHILLSSLSLLIIRNEFWQLHLQGVLENFIFFFIRSELLWIIDVKDLGSKDSESCDEVNVVLIFYVEFD